MEERVKAAEADVRHHKSNEEGGYTVDIVVAIRGVIWWSNFDG